MSCAPTVLHREAASAFFFALGSRFGFGGSAPNLSRVSSGGGAAARGSSPAPVLREPSPGPCAETRESPFFAAALAVIKAPAKG